MVLRHGVRIGKGILSDRLFRSMCYLLVGVVVTGVANYGLQVVLGRTLTTAEYGFMNVLLGVLVVFGVPVSTMQMLIARKTSEHKAADEFGAIGGLLKRVSVTLLVGSAVGFVIYTIFSAPFAAFLRSPSIVPVLLLGLCAFSAIMMPVPLAILQGLQESSWFAFLQGFTGPSRFILCGLAGGLGLGVNGVLIGLFLSQFVIWLWAFFVVKKDVGHLPAHADAEPLAWRDMVPVLVANLAFALITQMDLILVNRYFHAEDAALYASAAVLGRAVIYVPAALVLAMFPMVSESKARNVNTLPLLFRSCAYTVLFSGIGALLFLLWPEPIIGVLFAHRYDASAVILKYYGISMLPVALLTVLMNYFVARGHRLFGYVMMVGAFVEIALVSLFHPSMLSVVFILGAVGTAILIFGIILSGGLESHEQRQIG